MRIAIVDDEKHARLNLKALLYKHLPECQIVGCAEGVSSSQKLLEAIEIDVLLLDIEMVDGSGFDLLDRLSPFDFQVIFTTSHDQFAIKAFKYDALDYILKPIDTQDLVRALRKAKKQLEVENPKGTNPGNGPNFHRLTVRNSEGSHLLSLKDIIRMESEKNYTTFYIQNKPMITTAKTLGSFEQMLAKYSFFRCHQSHLINLRLVDSWLREEGGCIKMVDGSTVPLAKRKRELFKSIMGSWFSG